MSAVRDVDRLLARIRGIHEEIRDRVVSSCETRSGEELVEPLRERGLTAWVGALAAASRGHDARLQTAWRRRQFKTKILGSGRSVRLGSHGAR
jgi:hypothetical protein